MKEKLIEILSENFSKYCRLSVITGSTKITGVTLDAGRFAAYLIANGVTIQKWIPVTERLPGGMDWVLCACVDKEVHILCYDYIMDDWDIHNRPNSCYGKGFVTHWMPLPEPPKEDCK